MNKKSKGFKVFSGKNYSVLKTRDFGKIVFGCPPGIIKEFAARKELLPSRYVIPYPTFVRGRNNFDFEFIIYTFLFVNQARKKISIFCRPIQEKGFRVVLGETLFGPKFHHLIEAQFRRISYKYKFSEKEKQRYADFLKVVAQDKRLYGVYNHLLKFRASDKAMEAEIRNRFKNCLHKFSWLTKKNIPNLLKQLAKNYLICGQIRKEMEIFALVSQKDRDKFINSVVDFHHFDKRGLIHIPGTQDRRKKLKMIQIKPSIFQIYRNNKLKNTIDISNVESDYQAFKANPIKKPWFGITFLGVGSGFSPMMQNSCLVVWSEGKGIMVDVLNESSAHAIKYGITDYDVNYIFLTHVHSDHDSGLIEKILYGQRVKIISTRIIFESFLRKMEAITCFPKDFIEKMLDFIEVEPHKPIKLSGFKNTYFTFDYSLHSIPAGRFKLTYKTDGIEKMISHSGDTKYDEKMINAWYEQGFLAKKRKQDILGFIWDADLVVHDAGGGSLHTKAMDLSGIDIDIQKRIVLVHQHEKPLRMEYLKYAKEGETRVLLDKKNFPEEDGMETVEEEPLFRHLNGNQFFELYAQVNKKQ